MEFLRHNCVLTIENPDLQRKATGLALLSFTFWNYDAALSQVDLNITIRKPENNSLFFYPDIFDENRLIMLFYLRNCLEIDKVRRNIFFSNSDWKLFFEALQQSVLFLDLLG